MTRTIAGRLVCWMALISLAVVFATAEQPVLGADGKTPVKNLFSRKGRHLPPHYAPVVNDKQREEIAKIQEEYQPKIDALQSQIDALKKEQKEKIEAVLTAEQKKQVEEAEEAAAKARANRKAKASSSAKPADKDAQPPKPAEKDVQPPKPAEKDAQPSKPAEETPATPPTTPAPAK